MNTWTVERERSVAKQRWIIGAGLCNWMYPSLPFKRLHSNQYPNPRKYRIRYYIIQTIL